MGFVCMAIEHSHPDYLTSKAKRKANGMNLQKFQSIVLKLGNQMYVRHYLWINYPHDPQLMGIEMIGQSPNGTKRLSSCECGVCRKCKHRNYVASKRPKTRLATELEELGFKFDSALGIWTIDRSE